MSREEALAYLARHQVMTLATAGPDRVWAAAVFYVNEQFDMFFLSAASTRHSQHIAYNPEVAATVQEDYAGWEEIQGIQLAGTVSLLGGTEKEAAMKLYREKFRFLEHAGPLIREALEKVNWYRLEPTQMYFVDNSQGFGHRERVV